MEAAEPGRVLEVAEIDAADRVLARAQHQAERVFVEVAEWVSPAWDRGVQWTAGPGMVGSGR